MFFPEFFCKKCEQKTGLLCPGIKYQVFQRLGNSRVGGWWRRRLSPGGIAGHFRKLVQEEADHLAGGELLLMPTSELRPRYILVTDLAPLYSRRQRQPGVLPD